MIGLKEAIEKVETAPADTDVRVTRRIEIGHAVQQGDLYVFRVDSEHARGQQIGKGCVQVALGTGNGARHMASLIHIRCGACRINQPAQATIRKCAP